MKPAPLRVSRSAYESLVRDALTSCGKNYTPDYYAVLELYPPRHGLFANERAVAAEVLGDFSFWYALRCQEPCW